MEINIRTLDVLRSRNFSHLGSTASCTHFLGASRTTRRFPIELHTTYSMDFVTCERRLNALWRSGTLLFSSFNMSLNQIGSRLNPKWKGFGSSFFRFKVKVTSREKFWFWGLFFYFYDYITAIACDTFIMS